jgi:hypothetical protein
MVLPYHCHVIAVLSPWQYVSSDSRQAAWAKAKEMSIASGNQWTDRSGVVQNAEPAGIAEAVLAKWFAGKGMAL